VSAHDVATADLPWYVVSTKPRREELVRVLLDQMGLEVFLPMVLEWSRSRRRTKEQVNLLFPGYLFVSMSLARDLARVRWTPGVKCVIGPQEHPSRVDSGLIEDLASRMGSRGYIVQRPDLRPGDRVEVVRGPFAGLLGVVQTASTARERVRVLLSLFERGTAVELDGRDLLRVGTRC
jgi:transcription antitermination factor NusG